MRCKPWKLNLLLCCTAAICIFLSACSSPKKQSVQFFSMDTIMQITAYGDTESALQNARACIETLDKKLNAANKDAAVPQLQNGDVLENDLFIPLQTAQNVARMTNGALDVTLYPLSDAWGFYSKEYRVPEESFIRSFIQSDRTWSLDGNQLRCAEGVRFDLGSVAKGYAAQCAADILRANGISSAVLALGGNVQTIGQKPDGSDWVIGIADPLQPDNSVGELRVGETAVVTSGSYQRNFTVRGKTYHHIIDPSTGYPAESGLLSVTVLCEDGTIADALSTALFITGLDGVRKLYYNSDLEFFFDAVLITDDRSVFVTPGIAGRFDLTNEQYAAPDIL